MFVMKFEVCTAAKWVLLSYVSWHRVVWDIGSNISEETSVLDLYPEHAASGSTTTMEEAGLFETSVAACKIHDTSI
jgi:hypothetical protein